MMNCQQATRLISEAKDRPLGTQEKLALKVHLLMCSGCRNYNRHLNLISSYTKAFVSGADEKADR